MSQKILKKVEDYMLIEHLGSGQFASVYKARSEKNPNQIFAVKMVNKQKLQVNDKLSELLQTEIAIMEEINHPNIMHLFELMESYNNYYLVLQYCNGGDLEEYLKKKHYLPEDEAIYFLKQIMNGFRVLHDRKIMHRDIKLANIFLNNDTVVIGDFGFAKQGYLQATTILGTPLTMAPELLFKMQGTYNNKADLWSIGVVFYQMLFGVVPFDANSQNELKNKIRLESGERLKFPSHIKVSNTSKQLLINLLQFDPSKRIEWYYFFNHAIFTSPIQNKDQISQSTLFRMNQKRIDQEFKKNQQNKQSTQTLLDPQQLKVQYKVVHKQPYREEVDQQMSNKEIDMIKNMENIERNMKMIEQRYFHEKQKILMLMFTVRKLRNMSKMKQTIPPNLTQTFMFSACILLKKGLLLNDQLFYSLKNNQNYLQLQSFNEFLQSSLKNQIYDTLCDDVSTYNQFQQQMFQRFYQDITDQQKRQSYSIIVNYQFDKLYQIDQELKSLMQYLIQSIKQINLPVKMFNYCTLSLLNLQYCLNLDMTFPFMTNNQIYDWKKFGDENTEENAYSKIKAIYPNFQINYFYNQ